MGDRRRETTPQRRLGVGAEVVLVAVIDRVQEQPQLDIVLARVHFGIHTRARESSLSTSSGFAM